MTPALVLAAAAALGVQAAVALPSAVHHIGIDLTLIPDAAATSTPEDTATDRISITGPISLSAVDLGIAGSRGDYRAAQLNVGDQGIVVNFADEKVGAVAPIRKTIAPMLDGLCSASAADSAADRDDATPCAKKSSEIEIEAARAVLGPENHPVTVFTLRLARLDNKRVEPPMYAQFAFDGAKSGSLIFLSDGPPSPPEDDDEDDHHHGHHHPEFDHHPHHHGHPHHHPPPDSCDDLRCRVADFFRAFSPFSTGGPPDAEYEAFDVDNPGPHMHHGPPGEPGIGMYPGGFRGHGMHHGKPETVAEDDDELPPPPPPPHGPPPHHHHHHHPHPHPHPRPPFALFIINAFFSSVGFVFTMRLAASYISSYLARRSAPAPIILVTPPTSGEPRLDQTSGAKETSSLLDNAAPPPVYIEKDALLLEKQ